MIINIVQKHDTRCNKCKSVIYAMLQKIYGDVEFKFKASGVSTKIEDYEKHQCYKELIAIYSALQDYRNNKEFVKLKSLQRCDLYIPKYRYVIETDEFQHFSYARFIALKNYPKRMAIGYDKKWYQLACDNTRNKDNDPKYRDEQRAWYDTIRDFLPLLTDDVSLTIRIPLGFHAWCMLSPKIGKDVLLFKQFALNKI